MITVIEKVILSSSVVFISMDEINNSVFLWQRGSMKSYSSTNSVKEYITIRRFRSVILSILVTWWSHNSIPQRPSFLTQPHIFGDHCLSPDTLVERCSSKWSWWYNCEDLNVATTMVSISSKIMLKVAVVMTVIVTFSTLCVIWDIA